MMLLHLCSCFVWSPRGSGEFQIGYGSILDIKDLLVLLISGVCHFVLHNHEGTLTIAMGNLGWGGNYSSRTRRSGGFTLRERDHPLANV